MRDTQYFIPVSTYQDKSNIIKGEVGKWFNVRVVETTVPFREATGGAEGTFSSSGTIFLTICVGQDAFGTPIMAGGSPYSPHIYINDKPVQRERLSDFVGEDPCGSSEAFGRVKRP